MSPLVQIEDFTPESYQPRRRYGEKKPGHFLIEPLIAKGRSDYEALLNDFTRYLPDLLAIPHDPDEDKPLAPCWADGLMPGLDLALIFGMTAKYQPKTYIEIRSGNTTRFVNAAKNLFSLKTNIISIDPKPCLPVDSLCNLAIRQPLQDCPLSIFKSLQPGDILFFDGTHRILMNTDVHVFFLEILPVIQPGVIIQIHDIYWPYDYPNELANMFYSEQYMLGQMLVDLPERLEILMPTAYVNKQKHLIAIFDELWQSPNLAGISKYGVSFWFTKKQA